MSSRLICLILSGCLLAGNSQATSLFVGESKAAAVCSQCHGLRQPSADAPFPSLAGRDLEYLKKAIKQYRDKTRVAELMNNIAGSLTDNDINDIATYYSRLKP